MIWYNVILMFILEFIFILVRTLNIHSISKNSLWPAVITGNILGITFLITTALGVEAYLDWPEGIPVFISYMVGGTLGLVVGIKYNKKHEKQ